MRESDEDVRELQRLLDHSREAAGAHLRDIFDADHALTAAVLCPMLDGINVLAVATVTAGGEPRVAPVDGIFYRGRWLFGSSPDSARFRHLRRQPAVSACHTRGEELGVIVHGRAVEFALDDPAHADAADLLHSLYIPRYGRSWVDFVAGCPFAVIEPDRMFARRALASELPT